MSCQFSGNTECLTSALHSELLQGVLKVSSFSSTWLNPYRGRWQATMAMPACGWHPLTIPFFPTFPICKVGKKPLDGVPCNCTCMYLASKGFWTSCVRRKDQLLSVLGDGSLAHLSVLLICQSRLHPCHSPSGISGARRWCPGFTTGSSPIFPSS